MANKTQQAPRVAHHQSNMADAAAAASARASAPLIDQLNGFRFNGALVFGYDASATAADSLRQAHSLAIALSLLVDSNQKDAIYGHHLGGAIDAISTLIGLAAVGAGAEA